MHSGWCAEVTTKIDRLSREKTTKKTHKMVAVSDTLDQMDLIDVFNTFLPKSSRIHILLKST